MAKKKIKKDEEPFELPLPDEKILEKMYRPVDLSLLDKLLSAGAINPEEHKGLVKHVEKNEEDLKKLKENEEKKRLEG
jgi:hypothetical protein